MLAVAALGLLLGLPGLANAGFDFTTLDAPESTRTAVNGNSNSVLVGEFDDEDGNTHGFVLTKNGYTQIDVPGAWYTTANGINSEGQIIGIYRDDLKNPLHRHGFILSGGIFTKLDAPNSVRTSAFFINSEGQVVGVYRDADNVPHGYIWTKGVFTTIDVPNAFLTSILGINENGQVAGVYEDDGGLHGFIYSKKGLVTGIDVPDAEGGTISQGINDAGDVAGYSVDGAGNSHGFILSKGTFITVDVPGAIWTQIYSISDNGEVVGAYEDETGIHGFVGTPD
jgi:uncharacterized membrane protein